MKDGDNMQSSNATLIQFEGISVIGQKKSMSVVYIQLKSYYKRRKRTVIIFFTEQQ